MQVISAYKAFLYQIDTVISRITKNTRNVIELKYVLMNLISYLMNYLQMQLVRMTFKQNDFGDDFTLLF